MDTVRSAIRIRKQKVFDAWVHGNLAVACPGAEDGHAIVARFKEALEQIADTHRGETVLVFTHRGVMSLAIPGLAVNVRNDLAARQFLPNCFVAEVEVDADGWRIVSWPDPADPDTIQGQFLSSSGLPPGP